MDAKIINPFLESTLNVFQTMCFVTPQKGTPFLRKPHESAEGDITGVMGITGKIAGTIALSFEEKVILEVVSKFLNSTIDKINDDVVDAVGELTNMISGASKKIFAEQGQRFNISIPSVISGSPHHIHHSRDIPCLVLPFVLPSGKFFVEISIKSKS